MKDKTPRTKPRSDPPQPQPMELATLAALLGGPQTDPATALRKALELYVEAVFLCRNLPASLEGLALEFGSESLERQKNAIRSKIFQREIGPVTVLLLDTTKEGADTDEARKFLSSQGMKLKTSRAVLDNICRYWDDLPPDTFGASQRLDTESLIGKYRDGVQYRFPEWLLKCVAVWKRVQRTATKHKAWETRNGRKSGHLKKSSN